MAFGKITLDDVLKAVDKLSPEEKDKVKAKMDDLYKAEDDREVDKIEEDKAETEDEKEEKTEEVKEESEEIGKDVDEVENEVEGNEKPEVEEEAKEEKSEEEAEAGEVDKYDKMLELINGLTAKVDALIDRENTPSEAFGLGAKGMTEEHAKMGTSADERKKYFGF